MPNDKITLLGERIEDIKAEVKKQGEDIKSLESVVDELVKKFERAVVMAVAVGTAIAISAALFGIVSWEKFGTWIEEAMRKSVQKGTLEQLDLELKKASELSAQLEKQLNSPVRILGKVAPCIPTKVSLPEGENRDQFLLFLIPEVVDAATNTSAEGYRDNLLQMFETHVEADPSGSGWIVSVNMRVLTRLTDVLAKDQTKSCKDVKHFSTNRSTFLIVAFSK